MLEEHFEANASKQSSAKGPFQPPRFHLLFIVDLTFVWDQQNFLCIFQAGRKNQISIYTCYFSFELFFKFLMWMFNFVIFFDFELFNLWICEPFLLFFFNWPMGSSTGQGRSRQGQSCLFFYRNSQVKRSERCVVFQTSTPKWRSRVFSPCRARIIWREGGLRIKQMVQ